MPMQAMDRVDLLVAQPLVAQPPPGCAPVQHSRGPLGHASRASRRLRLTAYYTKYYRDVLGLPDWEGRAAARLSEEDNVRSFLREAEFWMNERFERGRRVLVAGGGTGAEFMVFARRGCDVDAVEPNPEAVAIAQEKARVEGIDPNRFRRGVAESLPFPDGHFDFVCCHSVLEHVQDVRRSVEEMIRVTKPFGRVLIATVDYRQCWENHYKLPLPMFLPRWMVKLLLRRKGRDARVSWTRCS